MADALELEKVLTPETRKKLLALDHVHDVSIGFRSVGGRMTDELAIVVYVDKKLPKSALLPKNIVPRAIDGLSTDVEEDSAARPPSAHRRIALLGEQAGIDVDATAEWRRLDAKRDAAPFDVLLPQ